MLTILIVDDEKIERRGIRFLLGRRKEELCLLEAENGAQALTVLAGQPVDILFSDIKMPVMDGLELTARARELYPSLEIVIFSGYNDFSYAKEALRQGVTDYVLKPVDPEEFDKTFARVVHKLSESRSKTEREKSQAQELRAFLLGKYIHEGSPAILDRLTPLLSEADVFPSRRMMLLHVWGPLFETEEEKLAPVLMDAVHIRFFYLNLNSGEALLFFKEQYADYEAAAERLIGLFEERFGTRCYIAVSRPLSEMEDMPGALRDMEERIAEEFYEDRSAVYMPDRVSKRAEDHQEDSRLLAQIRDDMKCRDIPHLKKCFSLLRQKYADNQSYSQMYVKFVFSSILKDVMEGDGASGEAELSDRIDELYRARDLQGVTAVVEKAIERTEAYVQESSLHFREEIARIKSYIARHYMDDLGIDELAALVYLSPGYLSSIFKEETGVNLNRYIRRIRMAKAKELLETTTMKVTDIAAQVGFSSSSYFTKSFREHFGYTPETCRKEGVQL